MSAICLIHNQQYIEYCVYCGPTPKLTIVSNNSGVFGPLPDLPVLDDPKYPGSIEGDPTELDRLRDENARLKAAVEAARAVMKPLCESYGVALGDAEKARKWLAANPETKS